MLKSSKSTVELDPNSHSLFPRHSFGECFTSLAVLTGVFKLAWFIYAWWVWLGPKTGDCFDDGMPRDFNVKALFFIIFVVSCLDLWCFMACIPIFMVLSSCFVMLLFGLPRKTMEAAREVLEKVEEIEKEAIAGDSDIKKVRL